MGIDFFYATNFFDRPVLKNITTQAINGIGGVYNNSPLLQTFYDRLNMPRLGVFGVNVQHHNPTMNSNQ
jgi:hypothetical protein